MLPSRHPLLGASAILAVLAAIVTWPQCVALGTQVAQHQDPYFSAWRLAWIAHAVRTDPRHLFDGPIFHPARLTLAYSDATLLEGALAAPLLWLGAPLILVYNLLLLGGMVGSGIGMFVLARALTGSDRAALVAAAIFALAPYRIEHYMHLELQWAMWIPLSFWAVHRALQDDRWWFGVLAGLFVWLQLLSCMYYGVFLAMVLPVTGMLLIAGNTRAWRGFAGLIGGAVGAVLLTLPYARVYVEAARTIDSRDLDEIAKYSATALSYLSAPWQNWIWGWSSRFGSGELRLFPGLVPVVLALVAIARPRRIVWIYVAVCALSVALSFGVHGWLYSWLLAHVWVLGGLRAPGRFAMLACCALAVLAGLGFAILERWQMGRTPAWLLTATLALVTIEDGSAPMPMADVPVRTPDVYQVLNRLDAGVVIELPMPRPDRLPGHEPMYVFWSTTHWKPLVNGYSGNMPADYIRTLETMGAFPDEASMARLEALDVRYVLVHQTLYEPDDYTRLLIQIAGHSALASRGRYRDWAGEVRLFELTRP